jgi:hypothetical protein
MCLLIIVVYLKHYYSHVCYLPISVATLTKKENKIFLLQNMVGLLVD